MLSYVLRRLLIMVPTIAVISFVSFVIIQAPPGDYLTTLMAELEQSGDAVDLQMIDALRARYHLDDPFVIQYANWIWDFMRGDFGVSLEFRLPVRQLIWERLLLTVTISLVTLMFTYIAAIPVGIYAATRQYSIGDYIFTFIGFVGLATPNFLLALVLLFLGFAVFGQNFGGLFSQEYIEAGWSLGKVLDLLRHLWIPVIVVGTAGTAGLIRVMRGNLLDELKKQYVVTARSKGLSETTLLFKYPVRMAVNPVISSAAYLLPNLISGATITSVVLSLPTTGPLLLRSLLNQDMYIAGAFVMLLSTLTVVGTLISDIVLAWSDPRIRFGTVET